MLVGMVGAGAASAQTTPTTYTPGTTPVTPCTGGPVDAGTVAVGQSFTLPLCGPYKPGSSVNLTVDGQPGGPAKTAAADGSIAVAITITSKTVAAINDPTNVNITCGGATNTAIGTGPGFTSGTATQTGTFKVLCTSAGTTGGLAFTGANVMKGLLAALLLIVVGVTLVFAQRRRSSRAL